MSNSSSDTPKEEIKEASAFLAPAVSSSPATAASAVVPAEVSAAVTPAADATSTSNSSADAKTTTQLPLNNPAPPQKVRQSEHLFSLLVKANFRRRNRAMILLVALRKRTLKLRRQSPKRSMRSATTERKRLPMPHLLRDTFFLRSHRKTVRWRNFADH